MSSARPPRRPQFRIQIDPPEHPDIVVPKGHLRTPPLSPRREGPKPPVAEKPAGTKIRNRQFFSKKKMGKVISTRGPASPAVVAKTPKPPAETARRDSPRKPQVSPGSISARTPVNDLKSPARSPAKSLKGYARRMTFFQPIDLDSKVLIPTRPATIAPVPRKPVPSKTKPPHSSSKALRVLGTDEKDTDNILKRRNFKSPVVYFYDPGWVASKKFFGHIAIKVFYDQANGGRNSNYYSYGSNGSSNESPEENDQISYKEPGSVLKIYKLALHKPHYIQDEGMARACQVINNKPRNIENSPAAAKKDLYDEKNNNCLHAVMEFLKNSGYLIDNPKKIMLPSSGMKELIKLNLEWISDTRKKIINTPADDKGVVQQMKDLLNNDIERLQTELVSAILENRPHDELNCKLQIISLVKLNEKFNFPDFEAVFEELCSMITHTPQNTDQKKLLDCLNKFPVANLAGLNDKKEFLAEFVQLKDNSIVKRQPVPMEVRAWARKLSEKKLDKRSALEIHRLTFHIKQTLQDLANDGKWFGEANNWLGKLDPAAKISVPKTPRPFK